MESGGVRGEGRTVVGMTAIVTITSSRTTARFRLAGNGSAAALHMRPPLEARTATIATQAAAADGRRG